MGQKLHNVAFLHSLLIYTISNMTVKNAPNRAWSFETRVCWVLEISFLEFKINFCFYNLTKKTSNWLFIFLMIVQPYMIWNVFFEIFGNGILLPKLFWPTLRKNCSSDREKTFEIRGWRPRIYKNFEITRAVYSNSAWKVRAIYDSRMIF